MKYSQLFGQVNKDELKDTKFISHEFLVKGGFIKESTAGRFYFLPLGWRVHEKIKAVIKTAMDNAGAQEMITPVLHPLKLWEETNRTQSAGFELTTVTDRRKSQFALGGTAEEMFVDLVRKYQLSYKDLPFNLYQFSTKFRDELRSRGGLLRVREFTMKDAYSFHADEADFKYEYELMKQTYTQIFKDLGLETEIVAADNGYIGGEYCHEFQVESPFGEGRYLVAEDGSYSAHEDVAAFQLTDKNLNEEPEEYQIVDAKRDKTIQAGADFHHLPVWQQLKNVLYTDDQQRFILAVIRGDLSINEIKLANLIKANHLKMATDEEIRQLESEPGFLSPVGLNEQVMIVGDNSLKTIKNAYSGANQIDKDALNINLDRDYQPKLMGDIAMAQAGFLSPQTGSPMSEKNGIEVGNIFQLGYHYSKLMSGATYIDDQGQAQPYYMGCYGIGLGRTMAAIVETHHDEAGIMWPAGIAPFTAHLISLPAAQETAATLYENLTAAGIEVLWDDRDVSAGEKFSAADLIGCPVRLVVSPRNGQQIEWKWRHQTQTELLPASEAKEKLQKLQ